MKKVPDEWQAQATPAILQVSSSKHNTKKITTRVRGPLCVCVCVCVCGGGGVCIVSACMHINVHVQVSQGCTDD